MKSSQKKTKDMTVLELAGLVGKHFTRIEDKVDTIGQRLDGVETRLENVEDRLMGVEVRLEKVESTLTKVENHHQRRLDLMENRMVTMRDVVEAELEIKVIW